MISSFEKTTLEPQIKTYCSIKLL